MKRYVLDEPAPEAPPPAVEAAPPRRAWPWRALLALAVVEPLALGALYVALSGDAMAPAQSASAEPATIAAFAFAAPPHSPAGVAAVAGEGRPKASRIAFERGKYVIDLRAADVGPALAMLAEATRATVHGGDVLLREATTLSRAAVASTPAEAWQAVFGDVANFAVSCTARGCAVWVAARSTAAATPGAAIGTLAAMPPPAVGAASTDTEEDTSSPEVANARLATRAPVAAPEQNANGEASTEN